MKICAIICEYNPIHNGHLHQLRAARALSSADALVCIMSGDFVQRGDAAILDKYTRARHAIIAGADAVLELPAVFATSNAELFAQGAIKILSSIPAVQTLCFGAETANELAFKTAARYLSDEPKSVSAQIKKAVSEGTSYVKARAQAFAGYIPIDLLSSPNNILGLEYTKAILTQNAALDILPIARVGGGYADDELKENFSSATAIRAAIARGEPSENNVPDFVLKDLPKTTENNLELLEKHAILAATEQELASVCDCTEGLENAFKKAALLSAPLAQTLTSARYTASRIRRIALQNLLRINEKLIRDSLQAPLYLRVLAAKKERSDVFSAFAESNFPLIIRAHDENALAQTAKCCYDADIFAENVYSLLYEKKEKSKNILI